MPFNSSERSRVSSEITRLRKAGDLGAAIRCGENYLSTHAGNAPVLCSLGVSYRLNGDYERARKTLEEAIRIEPENYTAWHALGNVELDQEHIDRAEECFSKALKIKPNHSPSLFGLSQVSEAKAEFNQAEMRLRIVNKLAPQHKKAKKRLDAYGSSSKRGNIIFVRWDKFIRDGASALENEDYHTAQTCFEKALKARPETGVTYCLLAKVFIATGKYPEARSYLQTACELEPDKARIIRLSASLALRTGDNEQAETLFRNLTELLPGDTDATIGLGHALLNQGMDEAAEALYSKAQKSDPNNLRAHHALAKLAIRRGESDIAEKHFLAALTISPENTYTINRLAQLNLEKKDFSQTKKYLAKALSIDPGSNFALFMKTETALLQGDFPTALEAINEQLRRRMHIPTLQLGKLMAEHGIGGKDWQTKYASTLRIAEQNGDIHSSRMVEELTPNLNREHKPETLSPEFYRELDAITHETRSGFFAAMETEYLDAINADAARAIGIPAEPRDQYRRAGGNRLS